MIDTIITFGTEFSVRLNLLLLDMGVSPIHAAAGGAVSSRRIFWRYLFKIFAVLFFMQKLYNLVRLLRRRAFRKFVFGVFFSSLSIILVSVTIIFVLTSCQSSLKFIEKKVTGISPDGLITGDTDLNVDFDSDSHVAFSLDTFKQDVNVTFRDRDFKYVEINKVLKSLSDTNSNKVKLKFRKTVSDLKTTSRIKRIVNISDEGLSTFNNCALNKAILVNEIKKVRHSYGFYMSNSYKYSNEYLYFHPVVDKYNTRMSRIIFRLSSIKGVNSLNPSKNIPLPYLISFISYLSSNDNLKYKKWPYINNVRWRNINLLMVHEFQHDGFSLVVDHNTSNIIRAPSVDFIYKKLQCSSNTDCMKADDSKINKMTLDAIKKHVSIDSKSELSPVISIDIFNLLFKEKRCRSQKLRDLQRNKLLGIVPMNNDSEILLFP